MNLKELPAPLLLLDSRASAVLYRFLYDRPVKKTILLPVNICTIVPAIVKKAGYDIEYVDIEEGDLCPDKNEIIRRVSANQIKYSAVLYNYTYGIDVDASAFLKSLKDNFPKVLLIDDRCSNMPAGEHSSSSDLTLYSTGYAKQVDLGYGGMGILNKPLAEETNKPFSFDLAYDNKSHKIDIRSFPKQREEYFRSMDERKAIITAHKQKLNAIYSTYLPKEIQLGERFNNWRFHILVPNKELILKKIFEGGLFASSHFASLGENVSAFPVATSLHSRVINLFNDLYFDEQKATAVCKIILEHL